MDHPGRIYRLGWLMGFPGNQLNGVRDSYGLGKLNDAGSELRMYFLFEQPPRYLRYLLILE